MYQAEMAKDVGLEDFVNRFFGSVQDCETGGRAGVG